MFLPIHNMFFNHHYTSCGIYTRLYLTSEMGRYRILHSIVTLGYPHPLTGFTLAENVELDGRLSGILYVTQTQVNCRYFCMEQRYCYRRSVHMGSIEKRERERERKLRREQQRKGSQRSPLNLSLNNTKIKKKIGRRPQHHQRLGECGLDRVACNILHPLVQGIAACSTGVRVTSSCRKETRLQYLYVLQ
jgi:hypothetical protein